jgi:hypothetical protein
VSDKTTTSSFEDFRDSIRKSFRFRYQTEQDLDTVIHSVFVSLFLKHAVEAVRYITLAPTGMLTFVADRLVSTCGLIVMPGLC